jgi:hypothetical protein
MNYFPVRNHMEYVDGTVNQVHSAGPWVHGALIKR